MLDRPAGFRPPAPVPHAEPLSLIRLLAVLRTNPLEAWTAAHFAEPIVMSRLMLKQAVVVSDPEAIRRVLLDHADNYRKDWLQRRVLSAGLTDGLLAAEGDQWRTQRRTLASLFAARTVASFAPAMTDAANALVEHWRAREGEIVDVAAEVTAVTLDVLERTIFSTGFGGASEDFRVAMRTYFETIGRIHPFDVAGLPDFIPRYGRGKLRPMLRFFDAAIDTLIAERSRRTDAAAPAARDILTMLLEARDAETGRALSEAEVRANILTFISAGHETTSNTLTWALFLLSQSDHWRERVEAEADREMAGPTQGLAERLVDIRAVIEETLRLYPPIVAISRAAQQPDELAGQKIERGALVVIAPYVLHRHRLWWNKPDVFDPNRFLQPARGGINRFAYLPFGVGPRTCIGMAFALQEATLVLATIVRHFRLTLVPGHPVWPVQKVTLRPKDGLPMRLERRERLACGVLPH